MIGASLIVWFLMQSQAGTPYHVEGGGVGPPAYTWDEIHDGMDLVTPTPCKGNEYSDGHGHCINPLLHQESQRPWDDYGDCYIYLFGEDINGKETSTPLQVCTPGHVTSESYSPYPPCSIEVTHDCIPGSTPTAKGTWAEIEHVTHGCWYDYDFHDWVCEVHRNGWLYWCLPNAQTPDGSCSSIPWK